MHFISSKRICAASQVIITPEGRKLQVCLHEKGNFRCFILLLLLFYIYIYIYLTKKGGVHKKNILKQHSKLESGHLSLKQCDLTLKKILHLVPPSGKICNTAANPRVQRAIFQTLIYFFLKSKDSCLMPVWKCWQSHADPTYFRLQVCFFSSFQLGKLAR